MIAFETVSTPTLSITKSQINRHFKQAEIDLEIENIIENRDDVVTHVDPETNELLVGYLMHDEDAEWDFWDARATVDSDIGEHGLLVQFTTQWERDEYFDRLEAEGHLPFIVDRHKHGNTHYSIANTAGYPDRQFDVAPVGVFVLDPFNEKLLKDGKLDHDNAKSIANSMLDSFSDYVNGEVYYASVERFKVDEHGHWQQTSIESRDNCIGHTHAMNVLKFDLMGMSPEPKPSTPTSDFTL